MSSIVLARAADGRVRASGAAEYRFGRAVAHPDGDDGVFAGWKWDGESLEIRQDPCAFYPLFAWTSADRLVLAASVGELLQAGAPRDLDDDALGVFLRIGFFLGSDTPYRSIRAVPPGARVEWSGSGPRLTGRPPRMPPASNLTRDEVIDMLIVRFRDAVRRRLPEAPYQMPLSGGRDSRHILLELVAAGHPPDACVTVEHFPPRGNDDVTVARQTCQRLGLRHVVLPQHGARPAVEREKNARTHMCSDEHTQLVALADYLGRSTTVTYDGIAGDVLSQSTFLNPDVQQLVDRRDEGAVARYVLDGYGRMVPDRSLQRLLAPAFYRRVPRARAEERLAHEIRRHLDAPNPISSFFFWNRTRREIALSPFALMRDVTVHAPYLDRDVFALLASLPASLQMDRRLHTDAILRAFPQYADIPYEAKSRDAVRPGEARRLALSLARAVLSAPGVLRADALLPGLCATMVDGQTTRMWHTALILYLAQLVVFSRAR